jgi:hypothetical protein
MKTRESVYKVKAWVLGLILFASIVTPPAILIYLIEKYPICYILDLLIIILAAYIGHTLCKRILSSPFQVGDLDITHFNKECIKYNGYYIMHPVIKEVLKKHGVDINSILTITQEQLKDAFNELIRIPDFQVLIERNEGLSKAAPQAVINAITIYENKQKLAEIYPLTLQKSQKIFGLFEVKKGSRFRYYFGYYMFAYIISAFIGVSHALYNHYTLYNPIGFYELEWPSDSKKSKIVCESNGKIVASALLDDFFIDSVDGNDFIYGGIIIDIPGIDKEVPHFSNEPKKYFGDIQIIKRDIVFYLHDVIFVCDHKSCAISLVYTPPDILKKPPDYYYKSLFFEDGKLYGMLYGSFNSDLDYFYNFDSKNNRVPDKRLSARCDIFWDLNDSFDFIYQSKRTLLDKILKIDPIFK